MIIHRCAEVWRARLLCLETGCQSEDWERRSDPATQTDPGGAETGRDDAHLS